MTAYCQWTPADVCGLRRQYEGAFWTPAAEQLPNAIWFAGPEGTMSGAQILEQQLIATMRARDWSDGRAG